MPLPCVARGRLAAAPALWRIRVVLADRPGALKRITHQLTQLNINILGIHAHRTVGGSLDELVLSVPGELSWPVRWQDGSTP
ncbi:ACT domain-containing protein [Arthrobacter crusticola]|uniref:ACT domain-containing protein n=1 Tax=Arthrobacter crusticola TaxID=2547960 RepID=UPI0026B585E4